MKTKQEIQHWQKNGVSFQEACQLVSTNFHFIRFGKGESCTVATFEGVSLDYPFSDQKIHEQICYYSSQTILH